ncbi:hypothetical protein Psed_6377 [Pseudonocardia dioxanivorans CB1190]|uniref:Uncharacterized protein n=1 Tax=Pseudonocardia dioxanivorans (strain ATCC 55486 / DSM 44775 / JCM 13855 / CB1190) TaxID=675635 RepID=F4CS29_PSEUX|nr:hypothetical protein Psed_6377 [Pseudonocardia dioxanivorans CB1190]
MARPRIVQTDEQIGFHWVTPGGTPVGLVDLVHLDSEPHRLVPTHLAALDDAMVLAAGRFGQVLGGSRAPTAAERTDLRELHRAIDRLCVEYCDAAAVLGTVVDARAGQILGTAAFIGIRARFPLGLLGPAPFDGELDQPRLGVVSGYGQLIVVDPERPWAGGRWVIRTEDGRRYPATLSQLLFDSSGVHKDAARREHRDALEAVVRHAGDGDPLIVACAVDWLLYDWLLAHRDGPDSGAVQFTGPEAARDAAAVLGGIQTSARCRSTVDPQLLELPAALGPFGNARA